MRLIDADALSAFVGDLISTLHKEQSTFKAMTEIEFNTRDYMLLNFQQTIDNAPTVCNDNYSMGYQDGVKKVLSERPTGEWIPVSEKLPEEGTDVLIWFEYYRYGDYNCMFQTYGFGYVCDGEWSSFINGETGWRDARIIAWMPLPEAYKETENNES